MKKQSSLRVARRPYGSPQTSVFDVCSSTPLCLSATESGETEGYTESTVDWNALFSGDNAWIL